MNIITRLLLVPILILTLGNAAFSQSPLEDPYKHYSDLKKKYSKENLPNLKFINQNGDKFDLASLKGKVVVINYWAFSCKPCIEEMPVLNQLVDKYSDSVKFLSILSPGAFNITSETLAPKLAAFNFNYEHVATEDFIEDTFGLISAFPTHVVIDKEGNLTEIFWGVDPKLLEFRIKEGL